MTYSINWPITLRSAVPFRKLYLPETVDDTGVAAYIGEVGPVCMVPRKSVETRLMMPSGLVMYRLVPRDSHRYRQHMQCYRNLTSPTSVDPSLFIAMYGSALMPAKRVSAYATSLISSIISIR